MLPLLSITESLLMLKKCVFYNIHSCLCCLLSRNGNVSIQIQALSTKLNLRGSLYSKNIALVRIPSSPCRNCFLPSVLHRCLEVLDILIFPNNSQYVLREKKKERKRGSFQYVWPPLTVGSQPSNLILSMLNSLAENGNRENMFASMRYVQSNSKIE